MSYSKLELANCLGALDLGASIAEQDQLLESARVETSVFGDLLSDRIDLVPGTKGSGKSALYRICVEFLPRALLEQRRVVVAHGVHVQGDSVFHAFSDRFDKLDEDAFIDFWCIYLVSLAHEQFIKNDAYESYLDGAQQEIERFRSSCADARIPEVDAPRNLRAILEWTLTAVSKLRPKVTASSSPAGGIEYGLDLFSGAAPGPSSPIASTNPLPRYMSEVKLALEAVLAKSELQLWLMVDRLDEIFPRRSETERRALRALLRTLRIFESSKIRVKVFLRDDILEHITTGPEGFTALTHVTARQADKLTWSVNGILTLVVRRLFASKPLAELLTVDQERLRASREYQLDAFYKVFPKAIHAGKNQSNTLEWIYNHCMDGKRVVTPRDVIDLLSRAKQRQEDEFRSDPGGTSDWVIGSAAILYGHEELSKRKRDSYLKAEFPHFWPHISKFIRGKSAYRERALREMLGSDAMAVMEDLVGIGVF